MAGQYKELFEEVSNRCLLYPLGGGGLFLWLRATVAKASEPGLLSDRYRTLKQAMMTTIAGERLYSILTRQRRLQMAYKHSTSATSTFPGYSSLRRWNRNGKRILS